MLTRRDLGVLAAGAFSQGLAMPIDSTVRGVMIGAQSSMHFENASGA
jgi:hypothetical protein